MVIWLHYLPVGCNYSIGNTSLTSRTHHWRRWSTAPLTSRPRAEAPAFPAPAWAEEWACRIHYTQRITGWFWVGEPCGTLRLYAHMNDIDENGDSLICNIALHRFRDQPRCRVTAELQMDADYRLQLKRGFECKDHFIYLFSTSQNYISSQVKCALCRNYLQNVFSRFLAGGEKVLNLMEAIQYGCLKTD